MTTYNNEDEMNDPRPASDISAARHAIRTGLHAVVCGALVFACVQSARAEALDDIRKQGRIRVAIAVGTPLFSFNDANGQLAGSDVDTARKLAEDLGVKLEVVPVANAARIPTLQSGQVDLVVADLAITPERRKLIDFSPPYAALTLIVAAPKATVVAGYADLAGKRVGVTRATVNDALTTQNAAGADIVRVEDDATLIDLAAKGKVDAFSSIAANLGEVARRSPDAGWERKFDQQDFLLGIAMNKAQPQLKAWVDDWVSANLRSGALAAIYRKYHGHDLPAAVHP
jgi:polar amino acid transport system substrate-binding protein